MRLGEARLGDGVVLFVLSSSSGRSEPVDRLTSSLSLSLSCCFPTRLAHAVVVVHSLIIPLVQ